MFTCEVKKAPKGEPNIQMFPSSFLKNDHLSSSEDAYLVTLHSAMQQVPGSLKCWEPWQCTTYLISNVKIYSWEDMLTLPKIKVCLSHGNEP